MVRTTNPSVATVKRLFAVSGNKCAFPKCPATLVDGDSGAVIGEVCHIRSASSGGPRYDASQTDAQRHAFENLILRARRTTQSWDADEVS